MNRREFLKALFALGGAVSVPALASGSDTEVDSLWETSLESPTTFYLRGQGALTIFPEPEPFPASRFELYGIETPSSIDEATGLGTDNRLISGLIDDFLYEHELSSVNQLTAEHSELLLAEIIDWGEGTPDEYDDEYRSHSGEDGQGAALRYFSEQFEYCDQFNIAIVEGNCPGSSYYAAELRMPTEEANLLARKIGIPIQFQWVE